MPKITFIIACYNQREHTQKCIESIQRNSPYGQFNFIFIDNGCTDGSSQYLKSIPNSHVIRNEENIYVNPAWNQGFKMALEKDLGEYICLCNNDIIAGSRWLDCIFHLFEKNVNEFYVPEGHESQKAFEVESANFHRHPLRLTLIREAFVGFCFFMRKKHIGLFYPIPETIKVLHGDDWIADTLTHHMILPLRVNHCVVYHARSATQRSMSLHDLHNKDHGEFDKLCKTEYKKRGMERIDSNIWKACMLI